MLELRQAIAEDIEQIWAVRTSAITLGCRGHYSDEDVQRWASVPMHANFPRVVTESVFYVIADNGRIAGFGFLDPATFELCGVFVHPDFQGKGLGKQIMTALEMDARRAPLFYLWVVSTLNAERFFTRLAGLNRRAEANGTIPMASSSTALE